MALRQMLGVACMACHLILATPVFVAASIRSNHSSHPSVGLPYDNSTISRDSSSSAFSTPSAVDALSIDIVPTPSGSSSRLGPLLGTDIGSLNSLRPSTSDSASLSFTGASASHNQNYNSTSFPSQTFITPSTGPVETTLPILSVIKSSSVPSESSQTYSTQSSQSYRPSDATPSRVLASGQGNYTSLLLSSSPPPPKNSSQIPTPRKTGTTQVGSTGRPLTGNGAWVNQKYTSSDSQVQESSYAGRSDRTYRTGTGPSGIAVESGKIYSSRMALATGGSGNTYNETRTLARNATIPSIKYASPNNVIPTSTSSTFANPTIANSTTVHITSVTMTLNQSAMNQLVHANSTFDNSTFTASSNPIMNDTTAVNSTTSVFSSSKSTSNETTLINSTLSALTSNDSTSRNQAPDGLFWSNSTLNNTEHKYVNGHRRPILKVDNGPIANSRHHWLHHPGNKGIALDTNPTQNETGQCSGIMTVVPEVVTVTFTALEVIYELTTVYGNATTPAPAYFSPVTACSTYSSHWHNPNPKPGEVPSVSSVLLVTKKIPVVVRSPQTVGPIYNLPTNTAQPIQALSTADSGQAGDSSVPKLQASGGEDRSAGSAPLHQAFAQADSLAASNPQSSDVPNANSGSNAVSPGSDAASSNSNAAGSVSVASSGNNAVGSVPNAAGSGSNLVGPGSNAAGAGSNSAASVPNGANAGSSAAGSGSNVANSGSNGGESSGTNVQPAIGEQAPGKDRQTTAGAQNPKTGGQTPSGGQTSNEGGQPGHDVSGDQKPKGEGQRPSGDTTSGAGDQSASAGSKSSSGSSQDVGSGATGPTGSGAQSSTGNFVAVGGSSSNPDQTSRGNPVGTGSDTGQYAVKAANVNNIPISIDSAAVIVGSQTINAGSPPTTVVANSQTITIDQSQIVATGTTVPIEAAVASSPASSVTIGSVPVVLQPSNVVIGSQTFSHGSSAAFAVYNDQTYSWDAKQLVGPGGVMAAFPSATTVAPRITAGGQVFSVLSSTLKAIGTDIAIPNTPSASPFVYQNQTFSVDPSKLVAPDMSITVPPATTQPTAFVHNGQTFSVDSSQFIAPSATIPLSSGSGTVRYGTTVLTVDQTHIICADTTITLSSVPQTGSPATPSAVTTGGLTLSLGPAAAVIASSTYSFLPGQTPATVTDQGLTVTLVSSGVHFGNINVPVPTSPPKYSVVTQGNLTFSVAPSAVVFNGQTDSVQAGMAPRITTVNGQEISIGSQGVGLAGTTLPLPKVTDPLGYAVVTQGDLTLSVAPSAVVLNGQTNSIQSGMAPIMTNVNGQSVSIGPQGVGLASTTIPLPMGTDSAGYAVVTHGALTFSVAPSAVVLNGQTNSVQTGMAPITTTVDGQIVSIGPQGVGIANTTISLPTPPPAYAVVTRGDLTFSVAPTEAVVKGSTISIGPNMTATIVVDGQTVAVGPSQIDFPGTTVDLPSTNSNQGPAAVTADGLTFAVGPTEAVVGGTTYAIGSGAVPKTIVVGSETIGLGTNGVVFPSTTVPPDNRPTAFTADGLTFSADATEAIINGTAYAIGSEAIAKTIVYGSETIGLGTKGIVLPSTTIVPWGNATQTSLYAVYSASAAAASSSMSSISAAADSANVLPSKLPGISPGGTKSDIHRGTGHPLRPPTFLILGATLGGLVLGMLACL